MPVHSFHILEQPNPLNEKSCAHAFSGDLVEEPFRKLSFPFGAEKAHQEMHFWAPHIVMHEGTYYMFYCAGSLEGHDRYRIHLALSTDLYHWQRHEENPMLIDGFDARDPMVLQVDDEWVMYYACTSMPTGGNYCVACVHSRDLLHWGEKQP